MSHTLQAIHMIQVCNIICIKIHLQIRHVYYDIVVFCGEKYLITKIIIKHQLHMSFLMLQENENITFEPIFFS